MKSWVPSNKICKKKNNGSIAHSEFRHGSRKQIVESKFLGTNSSHFSLLIAVAGCTECQMMVESAAPKKMSALETLGV